LENYLESITDLPSEVRRNFALMRELDMQSQRSLRMATHILKLSHDVFHRVVGYRRQRPTRLLGSFILFIFFRFGAET
jgi:hypothetical protein